MIEIKQVSSKIEEELNEISTIQFVLFNDVGDFMHEYKEQGSNEINKFVNGIFNSMPQNILPIKNLQIVTQSYRITFAVDIDGKEKNENGQFEEVEQVRAILQRYVSENNAKPFNMSDGVRTFEVTPNFSGVSVGLASQLSPIGNILPIYLDFEYIFVESGVNTNNVNIIINGENMFFQEYSTSRVRTAETDMYANTQSQKTTIQANGISFNLSMPLLNTPQSKYFENDIYHGTQNQAVCVERYRANALNPYSAYIMICGNVSETGAVGQNIGQTIDLVEGKPENLTYDSNWAEVITTDTNEYTLTLPTTEKAVVVFWGDGTTSHIDMTGETPPETATHTYPETDTYTIRYYKY